jgi:hypothetical protein
MSGGMSKSRIGPIPRENSLTVNSSAILFSRDCKKGRVKLKRKRNRANATCLSRAFNVSVFRFNAIPLLGVSPVWSLSTPRNKGKKTLVRLRITGEG